MEKKGITKLLKANGKIDKANEEILEMIKKLY